MVGVTNKLIAILREQMDLDGRIITEDTDIVEDLSADSLDIIELMMAVEAEYGLSIEEEQVLTFRTVGDVAQYISEHTS
ncbi:acyl carrier protein [Clostridia bacterium]|nr:acyl carrier protein [Clostridia bacterium]